MGKVFKNPNPTTQQPVVQSKIEYSIPTPTVLPADQFEPTLQKAIALFSTQQYREALPLLLNLEVTDFNCVEVHELLADVFLHINQLSLAKEQCQIYAQLLQAQNLATIPQLNTFDDLVQEAGNFEELQQKFEEFQHQDVSLDNFYQGTNLALKIATHHMANGQYKTAEDLLTKHRDQYLELLNAEEQ